MRRTVLRGGRWLDVRRGALVAGDLALEDGRIGWAATGAAPDELVAGAVIVDCAGLALLPGLIDAHVHPGMMDDRGVNDGDGLSRERMRRDLLTWLRHGVTTVLSLGLDRDFAFDVARERGAGARLLTAGHGFGTDGVPPFKMEPPGPLRETDAAAVGRVLERAAERGAAAAKIWYDDWYGRFPKMAEPLARSIIERARSLGLPTYAHVYKVEDAAMLARAGVAAFAHMPRDVVADVSFWELVRERDVAVVPTLSVPETNREYLTDVPIERRVEDVRCASANVAGAYAAGVRIAFGTDAGVSHRGVGEFEHTELGLLVRAGVSAADALRMATLESATLLGLDDRGELVPGKRADVVGVRGDPLADIAAIRNVDAVWLEGVRA